MLARQIELNHRTIKIEQDLSLSHAGTVWDGALVLAYFFEKQNTPLFLGKNVLELGSGTGVLGLCVALLGPERVYLTDLEQYLPILKRNCTRNEGIIKNTKMEVMALRWGCIEDMQKLKDIHIVVGSQLAYDAHNIGQLVSTFSHFLTKNSELYIIISYQKYPQPQRNLLTRLKQYPEFCVTQVDEDDMHPQYKDGGIGILLIEGAKKMQSL